MLARGRQSGILFVGDAIWIAASVPLAALIRLGPVNPLFGEKSGLAGACAAQLAIFLAAFYYSELYELRTLANERALLKRVLRALAFGTPLIAVAYYALPSLMLGRGILLLSAMLVGAWAVGSRGLLKLASTSAFHERILIVGSGETAIDVGRTILERKRLGYRLIGFLEKGRERVGVSILNPGIVGAYDDLPAVVERERIDRVLVCLKDRRGGLPVRELLEVRTRGVEVEDGPTFQERLTGRIPVRDISPSWFIFGPGFRQPKVSLAAKRAIDVFVAVIGLIVCAPVMALTALAVKLDSRGPALFKQDRVGYRGRSFKLVKFRSMRTDAEKDGPKWATKDDDRVTRVGRFIRKTRLDELPQFWNVLRGDMSLVGPRPERPVFVEQLSRSIPFYDMRHVVRPGVTGWAQVKYRYGASEEDAMQKLQYDLHYIKNLSIRRDLMVMFDTAKVMLLGEGAH